MSCETKRYAEAIAPVVREDAARDVYERGRQDERAAVVAWMRYAAEWERGHATHANSPRLDYALTLDSAANQIRDGRHNQTTHPDPSSAARG